MYFSIFRCPKCQFPDRTLHLIEIENKFHCVICGYERWATSKKEYDRINRKIKRLTR